MKRPSRIRPLVEALEDRCCPSATAAVDAAGNLVVTDNTAANLAVTQTGANSFQVTDGGSPVGAGTFTNVTRDVKVSTGSANDSLTINLNGFTTPGNVSVNLGNGANNFTAQNGTVGGTLTYDGFVWWNMFFGAAGTGGGADAVTLSGLTVNGGAGINLGGGSGNSASLGNGTINHSLVIFGSQSAVTLGDGATPFAVTGTAYDQACGSGNSVQVNANATLGNLSTAGVGGVTLANGATVQDDLVDWGAWGGNNTLTLNGRVDDNVLFVAGGPAALNVGATGSVGNNLGALLGCGNDTVNFQGTVGNNLGLLAGTGSDVVNLGGLVVGNASVRLGNGNNTVTFTGQVGLAGATSSTLRIQTGTGNDTVSFQNGSAVNGQASVNLGAGDDVFSIQDGASIVAAFIDGGSNGTTGDTFHGTLGRTGLTVVNFENYGPAL